ncbi:MAG: GNAT family N-acetyltransferase [Defluviitaleaceae bacterium]|nr:GNAT family N-acetyltransferase [Defluviitaleaceae bacterium]
MLIKWATENDLPAWYALATEVSHIFQHQHPGCTGKQYTKHQPSHADMGAELKANRSGIGSVNRREMLTAVDNKTGNNMGFICFSRKENSITWFAVSEKYRRKGVGDRLLKTAMRQLDTTKDITVCTFSADYPQGAAARTLYIKYGFIVEKPTEHNGLPRCEMKRPASHDPMTLDEAMQIMVDEITLTLNENEPSIYCFGSVINDDFKLGWSDIDIVVLTRDEITQSQADNLVGLRQNMLERYPSNPYFRLFEGGMLSEDAFINGANERTVYWGTSGQRITDSYKLDSFSMAELLNCGILLHGNDIRNKMTYPHYSQMRDDIVCHIKAAREHGISIGWLLDISRGIYTLRTGNIISKTAAGQWALDNGLCPNSDAMMRAVTIRKEPHKYINDERRIDNAVIQQFCDVADGEFIKTAQILAENELKRMGFEPTTLALIQNKDGIAVWRKTAGNMSYVMKCFDNAEYRREIDNYQTLISLGVPTLKVIAHTNCSIILEDIHQSIYRLGVAEDMNSPKIATSIAMWYKALHKKGRGYSNLHQLYDECNCITQENLNMVMEATNTCNLHVWHVINRNFDKIKSAAMSMPRTLTYNDFYYTNLAVAGDEASAIMYDYNLLGKGYVYGDIRNVCNSLGNDAQAAFKSAYGNFDESEIVLDEIVCTLQSLIVACERDSFPSWAVDSLASVKDGRLLAAVDIFLGNDGR